MGHRKLLLRILSEGKCMMYNKADQDQKARWFRNMRCLHPYYWPEKYKLFYGLALEIYGMNDAMSNHDLPLLLWCFRKTNKHLKKVVRVLEPGQVPAEYVKELVLLEDYLEKNEKNDILDAEALKFLKQKVERNNSKFADVIAEERANRPYLNTYWDQVQPSEEFQPEDSRIPIVFSCVFERLQQLGLEDDDDDDEEEDLDFEDANGYGYDGYNYGYEQSLEERKANKRYVDAWE